MGPLARITVLLIPVGLLCACQRGPDRAEISRSIEAQLTPESFAALTADTTHHAAVVRFYRLRDFEPAWVRSDSPTDEVERALQHFCAAEGEGLRPGHYATQDLARALEAAFDDQDADDEALVAQLAQLDVLLTQTYARYASDLLVGRVDPREVGSGWRAPVHEIDLVATFSDTAGTGARFDLHEIVAERHAGFDRLRSTLQTYRLIAERGGWPEVPSGEALQDGASGERVALLMRRLAAEGDLALPDTLADSTAHYDATVVSAVEQFQSRHGLEPDGVAGAEVLQEMNVSVQERIRQIELNLERWRWIPTDLGRRYVYVNIPAFELYAFDEGREVLNMRVVVGEEYDDSATPVFSDTMQYVEFQPYWNVPESIASEEIVPPALDDLDYLERNDYEIVTNWSDEAPVVEPSEENLERVVEGTYRIRQRPGAQNALGQVKFMFPNDFNIYLHDTPEDYLFDRAERAYSHGCIRVENPVDLAEFVLEENGLSRGEIESKMTTGGREVVNLDAPLPVYILYWTAFVDESGEVHFREDLYGQDAALEEALAALDREEAEPEICREFSEVDAD